MRHCLQARKAANDMIKDIDMIQAWDSAKARAYELGLHFDTSRSLLLLDDRGCSLGVFSTIGEAQCFLHGYEYFHSHVSRPHHKE